jgi:hypothetical protein
VKLPVATAKLIEKRSDEQDLFGVVNEVRRLINGRGEWLVDLTTTDNTATTIWFESMPVDTAAQLQVSVVAVEDDASEAASYRFITTLRRQGTAAVSSVGFTSVLATHEDTAAWSCVPAAGPSTGDISVTVTGEAGKTIHWRGHVVAIVSPWR